MGKGKVVAGGVTKYGDWSKLKRTMDRFGKNLRKNCTVALRRAGLELEGFIKNRILTGKDMSPLHPVTIAMKGSSKPLIDGGDLLGSVGYPVCGGGRGLRGRAPHGGGRH